MLKSPEPPARHGCSEMATWLLSAIQGEAMGIPVVQLHLDSACRPFASALLLCSTRTRFSQPLGLLLVLANFQFSALGPAHKRTAIP
ncbi:hypothetical protein Cob_v004193 [Colletotrichum orbiculare MAFF 240422]|uniref:Uncharacterized protein n=1 Tax=Colletotrichum orbiculare (strain 104-T / ATCC 96160 / CBS 514.97 / LARS 414 / MAFF 240422) TaxID=1213857 RepID=A0A484FXR8_COLOR|nr:hypothetical protein Cob_v004193 [Colletotrichum orbiculare MAFF 240422]